MSPNEFAELEAMIDIQQLLFILISVSSNKSSQSEAQTDT
jgi:hypothetical protein